MTRAKCVEITTRIAGRKSDRYVITIKADGKIVDTLTALAWNVTQIRNRECAKWSNIANDVSANAIPPVFTLNYETSWRNKNGKA